MTSNLSELTPVAGRSFEKSSTPAIRDLKHLRSKRFREAYVIVFCVVLFICWSPSNALAYLSPWIAVTLFLIISLNYYYFLRFCILIFLCLSSIIIYGTLADSFTFHSALLSLLTYGTFIFFLCMPTKHNRNAYPIIVMERVARWVLLVESILGIVQALYGFTITGAFDGFNGDYVEGTIHPWLQPELAFSNPTYAVNMLLLLLFLSPSVIMRKEGLYTYILGIIALLLASVMHALLLMIVAIVLSVTIFQPSIVFRKSALWVLLIGLFVAGLSLFFLRNNIASINGYLRIMLEEETPRTEVLYRVLNELPEDYPLQPFIGLGPGQFSSRAGLIGTGMFFGTPFNPKPIPLLPQGMSEPFEKHVWDLWLYVERNNTGNNTSSTFKPFFSWLSVYTEFGLVGMFVILIVVGKMLLSIKFRYRNAEQMYIAVSTGAGIIFIFLLGIQENYWEIPQAIFPGLLLLNARYGSLLSTR